MTEAVVTIRNLKVEFGRAYINAAVDDVSLEVHPGEIVALVGESGAGKTTTAKAVIGLLPSHATITGSIEVGGIEVVGLDERGFQSIRGTKVAMVFQEPATALNPVERIGWQIGEALRAHRTISKKDARARAIELLTRAGDPGRSLPTPALRWAAPTRGHRTGAGQRTGSDHRRRADHGARRHRAGRDPAAAARGA